jgi:hypothetical protein
MPTHPKAAPIEHPQHVLAAARSVSRATRTKLASEPRWPEVAFWEIRPSCFPSPAPSAMPENRRKCFRRAWSPKSNGRSPPPPEKTRDVGVKTRGWRRYTSPLLGSSGPRPEVPNITILRPTRTMAGVNLNVTVNFGSHLPNCERAVTDLSFLNDRLTVAERDEHTS